MSSRASGRVVTDPRITRRRQAVARLRRRRLVAQMTCVVALGALVWLVFGSTLLTLRRVQVVGARHTGPEDIAAAANLSGDENLLLLSTGEVARDAARLPWVARATVDRKLPGTIRVAIEERSPAVVVTSDAGRWLVGPRGHVLARARGTALPVLADSGLGRLRPGRRLEVPEVVAALDVLRALPAHLRERVEAVFAPSQERITLSLGPTRPGVLVRVGAAESLRAKAAVLGALLRRMTAEGMTASYVDVRVPSSPALGPAPAPAGGGSPPVRPSPTAPGSTPPGSADNG
jgi:cell division protein FtsQ